MNTFTTLARPLMLAILCSTAVQASAQEPRTRGDVVAELAMARASGELHAFTGEDSGSFWLARQPQRSMLTRQAVRAEVLAARALGLLGVLTGEDSGSVHFARQNQRPALVYAGPNVGEQRHASAEQSNDPA